MLISIQMPENKQIKNPDVANVVAYASYPYEDTGRTLEKHNFDDLAAEQYAKIGAVSVAALTAWIQEAKNNEYLDGGDPQETGRRRRAVAEVAPSFLVTPEASDSNETKHPPQFKGVGEEFVARTVGYMLTHNQEDPMIMSRMAADLGGENQSKISKTIARLSEMGYVDQEKALDHGHRPYKNLLPTEKMKSDANEFPAWRDQVELFELARQFGLSDTETKRYLVKLGKTMFTAQNNRK